MDSDPNHVVTTIHHNSEHRIYVSGYEEVASYVRNLTYYGATSHQLKSVVTSSLQCRQFMKLRCFGASGTKDDWLIDGNYQQVPYHRQDGACRCRLTHACTEGRSM